MRTERFSHVGELTVSVFNPRAGSSLFSELTMIGLDSSHCERSLLGPFHPLRAGSLELQGEGDAQVSFAFSIVWDEDQELRPLLISSLSLVDGGELLTNTMVRRFSSLGPGLRFVPPRSERVAFFLPLTLRFVSSPDQRTPGR